MTILDTVVDDPNGVTTEEICRRLDRSPQELGDEFEALLESGQLEGFAGLWFTKAGLRDGCERFLAALETLLAAPSARPNVAIRDVLTQSQLRWSGKSLDRILHRMERESRLKRVGFQVRAERHRTTIAPRQRQLLDRAIAELDRNGFEGATPSGMARALGIPPQAAQAILVLGLETGEVRELDEQVYYGSAQLKAVEQKLRDHFGSRPFRPAEFREATGTTRRFAEPLLRYFDEDRLTIDESGRRFT